MNKLQLFQKTNQGGVLSVHGNCVSEVCVLTELHCSSPGHMFFELISENPVIPSHSHSPSFWSSPPSSPSVSAVHLFFFIFTSFYLHLRLCLLLGGLAETNHSPSGSPGTALFRFLEPSGRSPRARTREKQRTG